MEVHDTKPRRRSITLVTAGLSVIGIAAAAILLGYWSGQLAADKPATVLSDAEHVWCDANRTHFSFASDTLGLLPVGEDFTEAEEAWWDALSSLNESYHDDPEALEQKRLSVARNYMQLMALDIGTLEPHEGVPETGGSIFSSSSNMSQLSMASATWGFLDRRAEAWTDFAGWDDPAVVRSCRAAFASR